MKEAADCYVQATSGNTNTNNNNNNKGERELRRPNGTRARAMELRGQAMRSRLRLAIAAEGYVSGVQLTSYSRLANDRLAAEGEPLHASHCALALAVGALLLTSMTRPMTTPSAPGPFT